MADEQGERPPVIAVKYCGGCNPFYDRAALVRRLCSLLGRPPVYTAEGADACICVSGCGRACAELPQGLPSVQLTANCTAQEVLRMLRQTGLELPDTSEKAK